MPEDPQFTGEHPVRPRTWRSARRLRVLVRRCKRKLRSPQKWLMSPPEQPSPWVHALLRFLEHNLFTLPAGVIAAAVLYVFPHLWPVLAIWFVLGLHRSGAIANKSRGVQICVYFLSGIVFAVGLSMLGERVQKQLNDNNISFATLVASRISSYHLPTSAPSPAPEEAGKTPPPHVPRVRNSPTPAKPVAHFARDQVYEGRWGKGETGSPLEFTSAPIELHIDLTRNKVFTLVNSGVQYVDD